ncbi:MAG: hypothetical protein GC185_07960 [Alphaproteobacteria bacterium]|nr:hypothetical protein [Alphaproteobacteria bacterium]
MADSTELPDQPDERHFEIAQNAAERLARQLDGNGLKAEQVRLGRHETLVHELPGQMIVALKPDIATAELKGKTPRGEVLRTRDEVMARAEGDVEGYLADANVHAELQQEMDRDAGRGFGKPDYRQALQCARNEFSIVDKCSRCNGETTLDCNQCGHTGHVPCPQCNTVGTVQCPICYGTGQQDAPGGGKMDCKRCFGKRLVTCPNCQGQRQMRCLNCNGLGQVNCVDCGRSGYATHLFQVSYHAECGFQLERQFIPQEVQEVVDALGVRNIATEGHAEIFRMNPQIENNRIVFPFTAVLPTARADFQVAGKTYPATVAGLHSRLLEIEPMMDKLIKPGINALFKLSKGPMASEALIDAACRYKVIRFALSGLMGHSKRQIYARITKEYPAILTEKYAKATVQYSEVAMLAIAAAPRKRGFIIGAVIAGALDAGWYLGPLRAQAVAAMTAAGKAAQVPAADGAVWLAGFLATFFTIKVLAGRALKDLLPENVKNEQKQGLPPAGALGYWALPLTAAVWLALAFFAHPHPGWIDMILDKLHIHHG